MKEHTKKKVNVLGIDVSAMRPDKAVNITMNYINRKEISRIYFHTAASSLFCQTNDWAVEWIESCDLVFAGDKSMEELIDSVEGNDSRKSLENESFADRYIKRLFHNLNRETKQIFAIMPSEQHLAAFKEYIQSTYPAIEAEGAVLSEESEAEAERVVNEINGIIPDIVFVCVSSDLQITLMQSYQSMMNTRVLIGIESLVPLIRTEVESIPEWIQRLHLTNLYQWVRKEGKLQEQIIHSIFRRSILQEDESTGAESDFSDSVTKDNAIHEEGEE